MGPTLRELCPDAPWYALTVRHQHEWQVERLLQSQGWETFVPSYTVKRQWTDRTKEIVLPLFAGYIFCRFSASEKTRGLATPGVANVSIETPAKTFGKSSSPQPRGRHGGLCWIRTSDLCDVNAAL